MRGTADMTSLSAEAMRRIRHFGDYVTVPLAAVIFMDLAGMDRLYLVLLGLAAWTLLEYLVHRFAFHQLHSIGQRLHQLHHDHPSDPDSERSSLSTPLFASGRISADRLVGAAGRVGDFRLPSAGVSRLHHRPLRRAPLDHRAELLALSGKDAPLHPSSPGELQFWRIDDFLGCCVSHPCANRQRAPSSGAG